MSEGTVRVAVTSRQPNVTGSEDILAVKFALDGTLLWTRRHGAASRTEGASDFAVDRLGNVVVAGDAWASAAAQTPGDTLGVEIIVVKDVCGSIRDGDCHRMGFTTEAQRAQSGKRLMKRGGS